MEVCKYGGQETRGKLDLPEVELPPDRTSRCLDGRKPVVLDYTASISSLLFLWQPPLHAGDTVYNWVKL
jgi:hypothetical protein